MGAKNGPKNTRLFMFQIPIVHELFLFDTIIKGKQPDMEPYLLRNCVMAEGQVSIGHNSQTR